MAKKLIVILLSSMLLSGCYDQVDIENINSISLICVDNQSIHFCCVTSKQDEKQYGFDVYTVNTDDLYYAIDNLSKITGKEISLSHLEAVMFSDKCDYKLIKKTVNSLLEGTNTHPKIMTAFYDDNFDDFFKSINVPYDTSISKYIDSVLLNNYSMIPECTALELSCALNFNVTGYMVPVIKLNNGEIETDESIFVNNKSLITLDKTLTAITTLLKNKKGITHIFWNDTIFTIELKNIKYNVNKNSANIYIYLNDTKYKKVFDYYENKIIQLKNKGFDLLGLENHLNMDFIDVKSKNEFMKKHVNTEGWLAKVKVDIVVNE